MTDPRIGGDQDAGAYDLGTPAQVEVLPHRHDGRVEALELVEQVGPDQRAAPGGDEHVPDGVMLAVVDLVGLHPLDDGPALVHAHSHVDQELWVVPAHDLGGHDAGVRAERLLDEEVDGIGVQGDVVVADQVVGGAVDHRAHLVDRRTESAVLVEPAHVRRGEDGCHPGREPFGGAGVQDQDGQLSVVL